MDLAFDGGAAAVGLDGPPAFRRGGGLGECRRCGMPVAPGVGPSSVAGRWRCWFVEGSVASHPRGQLGGRQVRPCEGSVGSVGAEVEAPFGEPAGDLDHHGRGMDDCGGVNLLAVDADVDGERDGAPAPGQVHLRTC